MRIAAQTVVAERFTWQHCVDSYASLYRTLIQK
ncbi:hypothetical protein OAH18_03380 [bacterium]|nr:hypothetical protein [bacterium]